MLWQMPLMYLYYPIDLQKKRQYTRTFSGTYIPNLIAGENKVSKLNFSKKENLKTVIYFTSKKGWNLCNRILQVVVILDKKLKNFIFISFKLFSTLIFHFAVPFQQWKSIKLFQNVKKLWWFKNILQLIKNCTLVYLQVTILKLM